MRRKARNTAFGSATSASFESMSSSSWRATKVESMRVPASSLRGMSRKSMFCSTMVFSCVTTFAAR